MMKQIFLTVMFVLISFSAYAATNVPFTIAMSEAVNVTGSPRIAVDVGGVTRYATYASGTGTSSLTFTYAAQAGDVDLDGVTLSSPIDLNGGTITDLNGNPETDLTFTVPNTSGIKIDYPSLSMDFIADADGRYTLNGTAYNDLPAFLSATGGTFARNSVGTYFDSAGVLQTASANQPRFDHDPVTHAPKGILIEESRTNYLKSSGQISDVTYWGALGSPAAVAIPNASIAPDGTTTATEIDISFAADDRYFQVNHTSSAQLSTNTIFSVWLKAKDSGSVGTVGTVALVGRKADSSFVSSLVNITTEWQRFSLLIPGSSGPSSALVYIGHRGYGGTSFHYYAWGAQHENGSFSTSYIPTTTVAVTRAADVLTVPTGGWYNSAGTLYVDAIHGENGNTTGIAALRNSILAGENRISIIRIPAGIEFSVRDNNVGQYVNTVSANNSNYGQNKMAFGYDVNSFRGAVNGTYSAIGTSGSVPSNINQLFIGNWAGNAYYSGWISDLKYYPVRAIDSQLQLMTQ